MRYVLSIKFSHPDVRLWLLRVLLVRWCRVVRVQAWFVVVVVLGSMLVFSPELELELRLGNGEFVHRLAFRPLSGRFTDGDVRRPGAL